MKQYVDSPPSWSSRWARSRWRGWSRRCSWRPSDTTGRRDCCRWWRQDRGRSQWGRGTGWEAAKTRWRRPRRASASWLSSASSSRATAVGVVSPGQSPARIREGKGQLFKGSVSWFFLLYENIWLYKLNMLYRTDAPNMFQWAMFGWWYFVYPQMNCRRERWTHYWLRRVDICSFVPVGLRPSLEISQIAIWEFELQRLLWTLNGCVMF